MKRLLLILLLCAPIFTLAQNYRIGDIITTQDNEQAIVFYVFEDGNHGWAMATRDYDSVMIWGNSGWYDSETHECILTPVPDYIPRTISTSNTIDGHSPYMENIEGWLALQTHLSEVGDYIHEMNLLAAGLGIDPAPHDVFRAALDSSRLNKGWYLPTVAQMRKLFVSKIIIESALHDHECRWLNEKKLYWTSTVINDTCALTLNASSGKIAPIHIRRAHRVRYIRNFGFVSNTVKDKYYCRGDKVTDLGYDFIAENDTTISRTYLSYQGFDSIVGVNIHVLVPQYELAGNMLVCRNSDTEIFVNHEAGQFTYNWYESSQPSVSLSESNSLQINEVTEPNSYSVTVRQFFEQINKYCTDQRPFDISVIETNVAINGRNVICYNSSETLTVPDGEDLEYVWFSADNSTQLGTGNSFTTPNLTSSTTYNISVSGGECSGTGSIIVEVAQPFNVSISGDENLCYGENASLLATSNSSDRVTYSWYNSNTNSIVGNDISLTSSNLYGNTDFEMIAIKTSGINPTADDIQIGDIVTTNNIIVKPTQWTEALMQNLRALGVVYSKDEDTIRIVGLAEFEDIPWGNIPTTEFISDYNVARQKTNGKAITDYIVEQNTLSENPIESDYSAALKAREMGIDWYLPASGELYNLGLNLTNINSTISEIESLEISTTEHYWSSTQNTTSNAWYGEGISTGFDLKTTEKRVRPVKKFTYNELISLENSTTCPATANHTVLVTPQQIAYITDTITIGETYTYRDSTITFDEIGEQDFIWTFHNQNSCDSVLDILIYVAPRTIVVTPNENQFKECGSPEPTLQYTLSENIEGVTGNISREEGETTGFYAYTIGTLNAGENYNLVIAENASSFEIRAIEGTEETVSTCESYEWHGNTFTETGDYTITTQNEFGCDVTSTLHLTLHHTSDTTHIYARECSYYDWETNLYGNLFFEESGDYSKKFYTTNGCDSIVTLHLTIIGSQTIDLHEEACDYFTWDGINYSESGDFSRYYQTAEGCDSTVILHLTINDSPELPTATTSPNTLCTSASNGSITIDSPIGGNFEYSIDRINFQTEPIFENLPEGEYIISVRETENGCTNSSSTIVGSTVDRPTVTLANTRTSVCVGETINLNSNGSSVGDIYTYLWNGPNEFTTTETNYEIPNATVEHSGEYSLTIYNSESGCDRTETVTISVHENPEVVVEQTPSGNEITITASGATTYTWENGSTSDNITVEMANDTIWVIGYNEYECSVLVNVIISETTAIENDKFSDISVYPVPAQETIFIIGNNIQSIEIIDINGRIIKSTNNCATITEINLSDISAGEYFARIKTENEFVLQKIMITK